MKEIFFNKYEYVKNIGKGNNGEVFLVKDLHLNKLLAMKKIPLSKYQITEFDTLKCIKHEKLPQIYDYRKDSDYVYVMMDYIDGVTLREHFDKMGKLSIDAAINIAKQLCEIISFLHKSKPAIIYRDLKPENIMIKPDGNIMLIDFGAVLIKSYNLENCRDNYGTVGYTDPELFKGREATFSSDFYSIGAILHEMISGINPNKPPYRRPLVKEVEKAVPWGISYVISRCLSENQAKRYNMIDELIYDLDNYKKINISSRVMLTVRKVIIIMLYMYTIYLFAHPLISGLSEQDFPIPYLCKPITFLILTIFLQLLLLGSKKYTSRLKIEKDILITDKRYVGLIAMSFFTLGVISNIIFGLLRTPYAYAYSVDRENNMWVDMCDVNERRLLLKNDSEYEVTDKVRFEIPKAELPDDKLSVRILAYTEDGKTYSSKTFNIKKADY